LISRFRTQEKAERRREERTTALYLLTRELADAVTLDQITQIVVKHVASLFEAEVVVLLAEPDGKLSARPRPGSNFELSEKEWGVANVGVPAQPGRRAVHGQPAAFGRALSSAGTPTGVLGVMGVKLPQTKPPSLEQNNLLEAFVRQAALVIDRQRLHDAAQQTHSRPNRSG
jgi:two-component system, OmpR family, sensor histidine kinase KdpD